MWYPWHPWYGRSVVISEVLERLGQAIVRCRLAQENETQIVELPSWMLDRAMSSTIHLAQKPMVSSDARWTLKRLLEHQRVVDTTSVRQEQQHFSPAQGEADAQITPHHHSVQLTLCHPPPAQPAWQLFPTAVQQGTTRLLAQLLHHAHRGQCGSTGTQEVDDD